MLLCNNGRFGKAAFARVLEQLANKRPKVTTVVFEDSFAFPTPSMLTELEAAKKACITASASPAFISLPLAYCDCIQHIFKQITVRCASHGNLLSIDIAAKEVLERLAKADLRRLNMEVVEKPEAGEFETANPVCPLGHAMGLKPGPGGCCGLCGVPAPRGWLVMEYRKCCWWTCKDCSPNCHDWKQLRLCCHSRHRLQVARALVGTCDRCGIVSDTTAFVMECDECNLSLCRTCAEMTSRPATQIPNAATRIPDCSHIASAISRIEEAIPENTAESI